MISLPIILYIHRIYSWFWPTLHISPPICYMQYMDRTFVSQQQRTPVFALGLELWRNHVVRSKQIVPRLQVHYRFDLILWNLHWAVAQPRHAQQTDFNTLICTLLTNQSFLRLLWALAQNRVCASSKLKLKHKKKHPCQIFLRLLWAVAQSCVAHA